MAERIHIVLSEEEKERYRAIAEREGETLSGWIRGAVRESAERYASLSPIRTSADLEEFFARLDRRRDANEAPEPDWEDVEKLIDEGRRGGIVDP